MPRGLLSLGLANGGSRHLRRPQVPVELFSFGTFPLPPRRANIRLCLSPKNKMRCPVLPSRSRSCNPGSMSWKKRIASCAINWPGTFPRPAQPPFTITRMPRYRSSGRKPNHLRQSAKVHSSQHPDRNQGRNLSNTRKLRITKIGGRFPRGTWLKQFWCSSSR